MDGTPISAACQAAPGDQGHRQHSGRNRKLIKVAKPTRGGTVRVTFTLPAREPAGAVSVVGNFNGWDPFAHPLRKRSNGGRSAFHIAAKTRYGSRIDAPVVFRPSSARWAAAASFSGNVWFGDDFIFPASTRPNSSSAIAAMFARVAV